MAWKDVAVLVTEARTGSADARDELVRRYFREVTAIAAALVNDATEAEDLAQEAFVRAFRNLDLRHAKIAAALDVPIGTVRSLVARARMKLTALLAEYAPDTRQIDDVFEEQAAMSTDRVRFRHVANGTCTTRIIESAGIPGERSIWADPLYEGPVPAGLSDDELLEVRRQYLARPGDLKWTAWAGPDPTLDPANDMREWRATIERHESYDELMLWFEHGRGLVPHDALAPDARSIDR